MSRKQTENLDYTNRDYEAFRELLIDKLQEKMPEYTDTSETDAGIVILEALANGLDILSLYLDNIANDVILPTTQDRKIAVLLARCLGYTPYNQSASEYQQVFVLESKRNKKTIIPKGTVVKTADSSDIVTLYYETMDDLYIPADCLGDEKDENGKYLYTVTIKHGTSIREDVIGTSTGTPLQSFKLNYTGVLVDSIKLYVKGLKGEELWTKVDSFIDCDSHSKVYMVSVDEFDVCYISFGNGIKGMIPEAVPNGIYCDYRVGGGEVGNVSANVICELDSNIAYVDRTFNLEATVLGHEKESLESIKQNAPASFRSRDRLVTLDDYRDLLKINFYDFLEIKPLRDGDDKKLVHLCYMLRDGYKMTDKLVSDIAEYISPRSMMGTTYELDPYVPQEVNIEANMYVDPDYNKETLQDNVEEYLSKVTFFYGELRFEDSIVKSDLENEIKKTFKGILSFRITSPTEDIISPSAKQNVLTLGTITINSVYL